MSMQFTAISHGTWKASRSFGYSHRCNFRLWSKPPANTLLSQRLAGMLVQFAERPGDIVQLIRNMDPATRSASQAFCAINDDQAFGTYSKSNVQCLGEFHEYVLVCV